MMMTMRMMELLTTRTRNIKVIPIKVIRITECNNFIAVLTPIELHFSAIYH